MSGTVTPDLIHLYLMPKHSNKSDVSTVVSKAGTVPVVLGTMGEACHLVRFDLRSSNFTC